MKNVWTKISIAVFAFVLAGCAAKYELVQPGAVEIVDGGFTVQPTSSWNRAPSGPLDVEWEENWTQNGPLLDQVGFVAGLPEGEAIVKQREKDERKVPVFKANMTPPDLISMIESLYRVRGNISVFNMTSVVPTTFLGKSALQFDFEYTGGSQKEGKGRCVMAIIDNKLYLMMLDGLANHYFEASLPEFDAMVASATLN